MNSHGFISNLSEDRQRLLKGVVISLVFHVLLILALGGASLAFAEAPPERIGPLSLSIDPFNIPVEEEKPVEDVLPEEPVPPAEEPPPESVEELPPDPEPLPEADTATELPEASEGQRPALEDSPASLAPVLSSGSTEPVPSRADQYEGSTEIPEAYAGIFAAPREAEAGTGGISGELVTEPEAETTPSGSNRAGIYSQDNRSVAESSSNTGSRSENRETEDDGLISEDFDFTALDSALREISDGTEGVFIVDNSGDGLRASLPGNEGENTSQITFIDGDGRRLLRSEPPLIPASIKSVGLPEHLITVIFNVNVDGVVTSLKLDPGSGIVELDASIQQSVRNWLFTSGASDVTARVQFLIKVK